jgi:RNA-directed DNA polymerase
MKTTMAELVPFVRGWRGYFGFCETPEVLIGLTRWVRMRLRAATWRQWKTPRRRRAALLELGAVGKQYGRQWTRSPVSRKGQSPFCWASNAYFKSLGSPSLFEE